MRYYVMFILKALQCSLDTVKNEKAIKSFNFFALVNSIKFSFLQWQINYNCGNN